MADSKQEGKVTGPTNNEKQMAAKPELVSGDNPKTTEQGARTAPKSAGENVDNPTPKTQAEMRGEQPPQDSEERQQDRQREDSPEELNRKSVAQGAAENTSTEETELSRSRSRTQNPSGGHTPDQLIHERKRDL